MSSAPAACTCAAIDSVTALLNGSEPVEATNPMRCPVPLPGAGVRNGTTVPGGSVALAAVTVDGDGAVELPAGEVVDGVGAVLPDAVTVDAVGSVGAVR